MSSFRPTRASPPLKQAFLGGHAAPASSVSDISRGSAVSTSELQALTRQDIEFLDAVIERASPTATTFLTVFKAYNDILNERGMDPQNEVVYYGKLLKLGTLKGKSWGDKWRMVKLQQGHSGDSTSQKDSTGDSHQPPTRPPPPPTRITTRLTAQRREDDLLTLHSHQDDSEIVETDAGTETEVDIPQYHHIPKSIPRRSPSEQTSTVGPDSSLPSGPIAPAASRRQMLLPTTRNFRPWDNASDATEEVRAPSTILPSYGASVMDTHVYRPSPCVLRPRSHIERPLSAQALPKPKLFPTQSRERRKSMINEDDAWTKIKMLQDEKEADRFREDRLVETCWGVWRSGFDWIIATNEQISQARGMLLLRKSMERWRNRTASELDLYSRVSTLNNNQCLQAALRAWKSRLKEKRQTEWRNDMRSKMKTVREKREGKLRKDAWAKWRQSYRSHLSGLHYTERLVLRFFRRWKTKLLTVDHLEAAGDEFLNGKDSRVAERCWSYWRRAVELRNAERSVAGNVGLRIMGNAMNVWKQHAHDYSVADAFHDHYSKKNVLRSWKTARDRIQDLDSRAIKHLARQDDVLLRAVARVWRARERGKLLEKVRAVRAVQDAWVTWHRRLHEQKQLEDLAIAFSLRSNTHTASLALLTWRQVHKSHSNALAFAMHYHSAQLRFKILLIWRLQLRSKLKKAKQARIADNFFNARRAWKIWTDKLDEIRRQRKLQILERQKLRKYFIAWLQRALRDRRRKLAEQEIQRRVSERIMRAALSMWTNRVIELKLREIEVEQQKEITLLHFAFRKWKGARVRHVEELSLMESYQDVKREENIRRMFHRWLSAARSARHRRMTLQGKEDEIKAARLVVSWDRWRERFVNEKLRPIEYEVIIRSQRKMLFQLFGIWQSKTKSLPALIFHASRSKAKYWHAWRAAMPQALMNSKARDLDKKTVLAKALEKWLQTYRTKIALKAVARARYLRLPTSTARLPTPSSRRPATLDSAPSLSAFPRRTTRTEGSTADSSEAGPSRSIPGLSKPFGARTEIVSLLARRPRSDTATSTPRLMYSSPRTRELSPTRSKSPRRTTRRATTERDESPRRHASSRPPSSTGGDMSRTKLWLELRDVKRKSRPPTEQSKSREPP